MMKVISLVISLIVLVAMDMQAQGFLKNLKKKIENVTQPMSDKEKELNTPEELLSQLPLIPSTELLLNQEKNEKAITAYLNKIASVSRRLTELEEALHDQAEKQGDNNDLEKQMMQKAAALSGLTEAEMQEMGDENTSPQRQKELEEKMTQHTVGLSTAQMEALDGMNEKEQEEYAAKHIDRKKLNSTIQRSKEMNPMKGEASKAGMFIYEKSMEMNKRFQHTIAQIKQTEQQYLKELKDGYDQLYLTESASERDVLTDKLTPISDECRQQTVNLWRKAYIELLDDEKSMLVAKKELDKGAEELGQLSAKGYALSVVGACIDHLEKVLNFIPSTLEIMPARSRILHRDIDYCVPEESTFGFLTDASLSLKGIGCGSFIGSTFTVVGKDQKIYSICGDKRYGPYNSFKELEAAGKLPKGVDFRKEKPKQKQQRWQSTSGKRYAELCDYGIRLNDGSICQYPLEIYACKDFIYWITLENDAIIEYSYRL